MGLFSKEPPTIIEWNEKNPEVLFSVWNEGEIKKGSSLIIRPGQDALFIFNGILEGVFTEEGRYDVETQILPYLSTLKKLKFGFNSAVHADVLFVNTKEVLVKWGTKNSITIPAEGLPGGLPIRAFGTFNCKITDYYAMIDKLAGVTKEYTVSDVREMILSTLSQLLMTWIPKEGHDIFNLQSDAAKIAKGIEIDLDMYMHSYGIGINSFRIESFSYPEEIRKMQEKAAAQAMMGDMNHHSDDSATKNSHLTNDIPKFCPACGTATTGMKFCGNCGNQLSL